MLEAEVQYARNGRATSGRCIEGSGFKGQDSHRVREAFEKILGNTGQPSVTLFGPALRGSHKTQYNNETVRL